jgi:hypothetical protein
MRQMLRLERPIMSAPAGPARCLSVAIAVMLWAAAPAFGQTRLISQYSISIAGITLGRGELAADIDEDGYVAQGSGRAAGFLRILVSGQAQVSARGRLNDGRPAPTAFSARLDDENEHSVVAMTFANGSVKALEAESSLPASDRLPVTAEHRLNVSDPVSALLVPAVEGVAPAACQRTLRIFDGQRRYDLVLSYKRVDTAKAAGLAGSVVVCAVTLKPIAGHKPGSALVKYLSGGRELELWLAPIAGTRLLGPYRLSVANLIGDLVIAATSFEATSSSAPLPLRPSIAPEAPAK